MRVELDCSVGVFVLSLFPVRSSVALLRFCWNPEITGCMGWFGWIRYADVVHCVALKACCVDVEGRWRRGCGLLRPTDSSGEQEALWDEATLLELKGFVSSAECCLCFVLCWFLQFAFWCYTIINDYFHERGWVVWPGPDVNSRAPVSVSSWGKSACF